jgi:hypothetical protein
MSLFPDSLPQADYELGLTLEDVRTWRAPILLGNSLGRDAKVGDMEGVGYVMVAIKGPPCFIPVAHSDEHNQGFDLLRKMAKQWKIQPSDFIALCPHHTGAYLHSMREAPQLVEALRRWHVARGPEVMITYAGYDDERPARRWTIGSRDFLRGDGHPLPGKDGLLPTGQRFVDALTRIRDALVRLRDPSNALSFEIHDRGGMRKLAAAAHETVDCASSMREVTYMLSRAGLFGFGHGATTEDARAIWHARLDGLLDEADVTGVETMFLRHDGLKNMVHQAIRNATSISRDRLEEVFGDLDLANDIMGRIDPGVGLDEVPLSSPAP